MTKCVPASLAFFLLMLPMSSTLQSSISSSADHPTLPDQQLTSKRVFLVRHGEVINPGGDRPVYYGGLDVPLSPLGELEAQAASKYLKYFALDHVFSSPLKRAYYGAQQVHALQKQAKDIVILEELRELNRGAWGGRTKDEIGSDLIARFDACDESVTPEGGESYLQLKKRAMKAKDVIVDTMKPGEQACVVSHLQVTRCLVSDALGIPTSEMTELKIATASVSCIDYDKTEDDGVYSATVHFQSFKPQAGLAKSEDGAN